MDLRPDLDTPAEMPAADPATECGTCRKPAALCVCAGVEPIENRKTLLILQHPQEQDRTLGSARLAALHFSNAVFKVGLSWPSLSKVLGRDADPKRWAVLYLGSSRADELPRDRDVVVLNRKGEALPDQDAALKEIDGVILLDGTWSQAKALWWRNAWMLKCRRVVLNPRRPSRYGSLRKEPRREGLSTIEAAAMLMARLERKPEIVTALDASFERMLARFRHAKRTTPELVRR